MRRSELEHLIRAASAITDQYEKKLKMWVSVRMPER